MKDFKKEIKVAVAESQNGYCAHSDCLKQIHSIHHKLPNNVYNQKKYPLFLQSPMNGVGLCEYHHSNYAHKFKVTDKQAKLYEEWLNGIKIQNR